MFGNKRKYNDKILQKVTKWATKIVYTSLIEQIARGAKCYFPDLYETDVLWTLRMASWRHVAACAFAMWRHVQWGPWALKIDVRKRGPSATGAILRAHSPHCGRQFEEPMAPVADVNCELLTADSVI